MILRKQAYSLPQNIGLINISCYGQEAGTV